MLHLHVFVGSFSPENWKCICVILPTNQKMAIKEMFKEAFLSLILYLCYLAKKKCLKKIKENSFKKIMPQLQRQCRLLVTFQLRNHSALGCT